MRTVMRIRTLLALLAVMLAVTLAVTGCSDDAAEPGQPAPAASQEPAAEPSTAEPSTAPSTAPAEVESSTPPSADFSITNKSNLSPDLAQAYQQHCGASGELSLECEIHRSLLIADVVMALEEIDQARDQRGAEEALAALDFTDEPEILVAALRVLGQFRNTTPGIAEKALPLMLDSPWLMVQQLAAGVLSGNPDPDIAGIGSLWGGNHNALYAEDEYSEYPDFAPHYLDMGFPEYPDAEWFSPADSDRSVGWWTTDDAATVSEWLSDELDIEPLSFMQWSELMMMQATAAFQAIDPAKQEELQRLSGEFAETQDLSLLERIQKLQEEMYAPLQDAGKVTEMGVGNLALVSGADIFESVRFFIAEEKAGHVARAIVVYPLPGLKRTVIQEAWNLLDYASAWPLAQSMEE